MKINKIYSAYLTRESTGRRKIERDRMIGTRTQALDNLCIDMRIQRRTGDNFLKQLGIDTAGTRERHQVAAGSQQL